MSVKHFFYLSELDIPVKVRVTSIEGKTVHDQLIREVLATPGESATPLIQLYVTGQIYSNGAPLGLPASTTIITFSGPNIVFNEWLTFPVTYKDLSPSSCFVFTLWKIEPPAPYPSRPGVSPLLPINSSSSTSPSSAKVIDSLSRLPPTLGSSFIPPLGQSLSEAVQLGSAGMTPRQTPLGGSCMPVFNKAGMVKLGTRRLYLWPGVQGDGTQNTTTPYKDPSQKALKEAWSNSLLQVHSLLIIIYAKIGFTILLCLHRPFCQHYFCSLTLSLLSTTCFPFRNLIFKSHMIEMGILSLPIG